MPRLSALAVLAAACLPAGLPLDGPAGSRVTPSSLFEPRCLGTLEATTPTGETAADAWAVLASQLPGALDLSLSVHHGDASLVDAIFPEGLSVEVDWANPSSVAAFAVDPEVLVDPWAIADPSRCPTDELQLQVDGTGRSGGGTPWQATWTVGWHDGALRWNGISDLSNIPGVAEAVEAALASRGRVAVAEGASFAATGGDLEAFTFEVSGREVGRTTRLASGTATRTP